MWRVNLEGRRVFARMGVWAVVLMLAVASSADGSGIASARAQAPSFARAAAVASKHRHHEYRGRSSASKNAACQGMVRAETPPCRLSRPDKRAVLPEAIITKA
jgi:hypothetical protein